MSAIVTVALPFVGQLIDRIFPDKEAAARAKAELLNQAQSGELEELATRAGIITAEAQGGSWIQRNWRPMLMLLFGTIIAINYVVSPIFNTPRAEIPPDMWDLLKLGVGGYIVGRSAEKGVKLWKS